MVSAIIVDDEFLTVESLEKIIRNSDLEINIVGEAFDGINALKLIEETNPDFAIIDIRMPNMDGLELIKVLKERSLKTKIIILSAYRDFEYARQAIQFGACGYLVKPVDKIKLFNEIKIVIKKIQEEMNIDKLKGIVNESLPLVKMQYLKQLLFSSTGFSEKDNQDRSLIEIDELDCQLLLVSLQGLTSSDNSSPLDVALESRVIESAENEFKEQTKVIAFFSKQDELVVIFNNRKDLNTTLLAQNTVVSLKQFLHIDIYAGLSNSGFSFSDTRSAYQEARIALIYKFYLGLNSVVPYDQVKDIRFTNDFVLLKDEDYLVEQIKLGINYEVMHILDSMYSSLKENMSINPEMVYNAYYRLILYLKKALKDTCVDREFDTQLVNLEYDDLKRFQTLDQLSEFINQMIINLISYIESSRKSDNSRIIDKVKHFCEMNYSEDISLDLISEHVSMSKNYFCSFFKKKTGESFWDYVTNLRINKAKELLETTDIKIGIITEKVGYKNISHFCKIFKETLGISPAEYKQRYLEKGN